MVKKQETDPELYSLRSPIGFCQKVVLQSALINLLAKNKIDIRKKAILDLGCGTGEELRFLAELRGSCEDLYGIDLDPKRIKYAKKVNPAITYNIGNITNIPGNKQYDIITAYTSFMFLKTLKELYSGFDTVIKHLTPKGYFIFMDIAGRPGKTEIDGKRCFSDNDLTGLATVFGLKITYAKKLFKNFISNGQEICTAYLGLDIPLWQILNIEDNYQDITYYNNVLVLFQKGE